MDLQCSERWAWWPARSRGQYAVMLRDATEFAPFVQWATVDDFGTLVPTGDAGVFE